MALVDEMRKRFPREILTEEIGNAHGLTAGLVLTVLLEAEKEGWEYGG